MSNFGGEIVTQLEHPCPELDELHIGQPEVRKVGSELSHKLIGRDFSEIQVSAKNNHLVYVTVRFPALVEDLDTLRAIKKAAESTDEY